MERNSVVFVLVLVCTVQQSHGKKSCWVTISLFMIVNWCHFFLSLTNYYEIVTNSSFVNWLCQLALSLMLNLWQYSIQIVVDVVNIWMSIVLVAQYVLLPDCTQTHYEYWLVLLSWYGTIGYVVRSFSSESGPIWIQLHKPDTQIHGFQQRFTGTSFSLQHFHCYPGKVPRGENLTWDFLKPELHVVRTVVLFKTPTIDSNWLFFQTLLSKICQQEVLL